MTQHLLSDQHPDAHLRTVELTEEEANSRWERMRIMPCPDCSEAFDGDAIVYHET